MVPDGLYDKVAADYVRILKDDGFAMYTGIYCNKHTVPALTELGYGREMLDLLFSKNNKNFAFMLDNGATSLWECFDLPETNLSVASLNHPMQGAFTCWFYSHILGLTPSEEAPGFKKFNVRPYVIDGINAASGSYKSQYGNIAINWNVSGGVFSIDVEVPANTVALIELPGGSKIEAGSGKHSYSEKL